ncbi:MAG: 16S rRNA (uracil1498-N3)-methyltransferase [Bacteroidia bacterium]
MNCILLEVRELDASGVAHISGARFEHIRDILRAKTGESIKVGIIGGKLGLATITALTNDSIELNVCCDEPPPAKLPLTLILALPRPKAARRLCRTIAELGVPKLILLNSYRVEKSYWQSPLLAPDKVRDYFIEGLQQAGDTIMPELQIEQRFKPFVEDRLAAITNNTRALVAHPYNAESTPSAEQSPTVLAVGPEGGFIPYEIDKLKAAGMQTISIGERILKVETAVPTLLAKLFD